MGQTDVSPRVARGLAAVFLLALFTVPLVQLVVDPGFYRTWGGAPTAATSSVPGDGLDWIFTRNRALLAAIDRADDRVADASWVGTHVRPLMQYLLTNVLGATTDQVHRGADGWLFFGPDVAYATGKGFLDTAQLRRRAATGTTLVTDPHPDPRPALVELSRQLASRGIDLVVMPVPVKPAVHPEYLGRSESFDSVQNPSYARLVDELSDHGIPVFDVAAKLADVRRSETEPLFLTTDTHWHPRAVEAIAERLGAFLAQRLDLPAPSAETYQAAPVTVTNQGDTARLLGLPAHRSPFPPETVVTRRIEATDGGLWQPDTQSEILLLGDSFANVFTVEQMGWGQAAGLAAQLSFVLQHRVDQLTRNDNGAYATREALATELRRNPDRLVRTRVVIYQFASRELAQGDWRPVQLFGTPPADLQAFATPVPDHTIAVRGTLRQIGPIPRPRSVPYSDHIVALHLTDLTSEAGDQLDGTEALVYVWSMQDDEPTPITEYRPGDAIRLRLSSWASVEPRLGAINRGEIPDPGVRVAEPWWGEPADDAP